MKKNVTVIGIITAAMVVLTACTGENQAAGTESGNLTIAAASSLENCFTEELIPMFREKYPQITIEGAYDSSGKLQAQIEEGAPADLFFSAAVKQMDDLLEQGLIVKESVTPLLENKIVLIVPAGEEEKYTSFEDIVKAEQVALGDPESVPVGAYAKESLTNLGLWDEILSKTSFGTNVTEVLNWVAEGSAQAGIVYSTDAAQKPDKVFIVAEAPEGTVKKALYPIGIVKDCKNPKEASLFLEFLKSEEAMKVFQDNGFAAAK